MNDDTGDRQALWLVGLVACLSWIAPWTATHGEGARSLLGRLAFVEMTPTVLARATEPFPSPVRTLEALHLASIEFLRAHRQDVRLATYDKRLAGAARRLGIPAYALGR